MRIALIGFIFFVFLRVSAQETVPFQKGQWVHPDASIVSATIFKDSDDSAYDCKSNPNLCVGWAKPQDTIMKILNRKTENGKVQVRFVYDRKPHKGARCPPDSPPDEKGRCQVNRVGWISVQYLEGMKNKGKTAAQASSPRKNGKLCPLPDHSINRAMDSHEQEMVEELKSHIGSINSETAYLNQIVGKCSAPEGHVNDKERWLQPSDNLYRTKALPALQATIEKHGLPEMSKEVRDPDNPNRITTVPMTESDLIHIDALARTLYGEMDSCEEQDYFAVAKVAINRLNDKQGRFGKDLTTIVTTPNEFSNWKYDDPNIVKSLCPPSGSNKNFSHNSFADKKNDGKPPKSTPDREIQFWNQALRIATTAILHRPSFEDYTSEVKQVYYTSNLDSFFCRMPANPPPTINGLEIFTKCVQLWEEKKDCSGSKALETKLRQNRAPASGK